MKITNKDINELIGIKETFELPDKLIKILLNEEEKDKLLNKFLDTNKYRYRFTKQ